MQNRDSALLFRRTPWKESTAASSGHSWRTSALSSLILGFGRPQRGSMWKDVLSRNMRLLPPCREDPGGGGKWFTLPFRSKWFSDFSLMNEPQAQTPWRPHRGEGANFYTDSWTLLSVRGIQEKGRVGVMTDLITVVQCRVQKWSLVWIMALGPCLY